MFKKLAATIAKNAHTYKTQEACRLAVLRVRAAYYRAGGYGNEYHILRDAVWACQDRWMELECERMERKYATAEVV